MIRFDTLESLGARAAVISDRSDGDCRPPEPDDPAAPPGPRARLCARFGLDARDIVRANQVHGATIARVRDQDRGRGALAGMPAVPAADGLITDVPGLPLAILVADCVPVFLFDPVRRLAGLVHAGREGTRAGIARLAVAAMLEEWGGSPRDLHAVVGPSAGPRRYEVSEELAREWRAAGLPAQGRLLDLWEANVLQMESVGVPRAQIEVSGICTLTDGRLYSHRLGAGSARNMALLAV